MTDVESIAQEDPSPTKVRTDLKAGGRFGRDTLTDAVRTSSSQSVYLEVVGILQHRREVVIVGRDVGRVIAVKVLDETGHEASRMLHLFAKRLNAVELLGR